MIMTSEDKKTFAINDIEYLYQDDIFIFKATRVLHFVYIWPDEEHIATKVY